MKLAKVVDVRDAHSPNTADSLSAISAQRIRAEQLLRLYPETTPDQTEEIRVFLTKGAHFDVGMVAGSDEFYEKVIAFRKTHEKHFQLSRTEMLIPILSLVMISAFAWYCAF